MIAIGMNGAQLSDTHGFPARLITPGLYGFVGATKWLTKLTLTTYAADQAYWTKRQWATDAPIKTSARIDTPGAAVDDQGRHGRHRRRRLGPAPRRRQGRGQDRRRPLAGDAGSAPTSASTTGASGTSRGTPSRACTGISVRATDLKGRAQITERATPFPSGSSGIQEVVVTVA